MSFRLPRLVPVPDPFDLVLCAVAGGGLLRLAALTLGRLTPGVGCLVCLLRLPTTPLDLLFCRALLSWIMAGGGSGGGATLLLFAVVGDA